MDLQLTQAQRTMRDRAAGQLQVALEKVRAGVAVSEPEILSLVNSLIGAARPPALTEHAEAVAREMRGSAKGPADNAQTLEELAPLDPRD